MTLSGLHVQARAGGVLLPADEVEVTLDESRVPFAAARLTMPYTVALADLLDPRASAVPRVLLDLAQRFSGSQPVSVLPGSVADLTARYGGSVSAVTYDLGEAWNAGGFRRTRRHAFDLGVRSRRIDHLAGTLTVELASDEALLTDSGLLSATALSPAGLTVRDAVQLVLDRVAPGAALVTSEGAQTIAADAAVWAPGVSGWDYLSPLTASANLRLWCDEHRVWRLAAPESIIAPGQATLAATGTVTGASDTVDRNDDLWADAVVVTYTWTDASGVRHVAYDVAGPGDASRVLHIERATPWPRAGEAAARLRKLRGRGRVLSIDAVADPEVVPAQAASLSVPGTPVQTGWVQAVTWQLPADEMTVTTRDLIDTPATAWAFGPAGVSWADLPAGMSWTEFDWTEVA